MTTTFRDGGAEFIRPEGPPARPRLPLFEGRVGRFPIDVKAGLGKALAFEVTNTGARPARLDLHCRAARDIKGRTPHWSVCLEAGETKCAMLPAGWSRAPLFAVAIGEEIGLRTFEVDQVDPVDPRLH